MDVDRERHSPDRLLLDLQLGDLHRGRQFGSGDSSVPVRIQAHRARDRQMPLFHRLQMFQADVLCLDLRLVSLRLRINGHLRLRCARGKVDKQAGAHCLAVTLKFEGDTLNRLRENLAAGQIDFSMADRIELRFPESMPETGYA